MIENRATQDGPVRRAQRLRVEAAAGEALGAEEFGRLRAEGRQLELEEVVRLAFADQHRTHATRPVPWARLPSIWPALTGSQAATNQAGIAQEG